MKFGSQGTNAASTHVNVIIRSSIGGYVFLRLISREYDSTCFLKVEGGFEGKGAVFFLLGVSRLFELHI